MTKRKRNAISRALGIVRKYFPEVNKVADAKAPLSLEVTNRDQTIATRRAHKTCAMAVACKRKLNLDGVIISIKTAYMIKGKKAIRFAVPEHVSREIVSYDRGSSFEPGVYKLNVPDVAIGESRSGVDIVNRTPHDHHRSKAIHLPTKNIRSVLGSEVE